LSKIVSVYSQGVTATPVNGIAAFPKYLKTDRLWSGVRLTWGITYFPLMRIVRRTLDFPQNETDGVIVYEGGTASRIYEDRAAPRGEVSYYTLYFREGLSLPWQTIYRMRVQEYCLQENTTPELLWKLLPRMYRGSTELRDNPNDTNIHVEMLIAPIFREMESLIWFLPQTLDVDKTHGKYLKSIAHYIGLEPNLELPYLQQRQEIKAATKSYSKKGLISSIESLGRALSGLETTVVDYNQLILFSNYQGNSTIDFNNPLETYYYDSSKDITYRLISTEIEDESDTITFRVFFNIEHGKGIEQLAVMKLNRAFYSLCPVFMEYDALFEVNRVESVNLNIIDSRQYTVEDYNTEEYITGVLVSGDSQDQTNSEDSTTPEFRPSDHSTITIV
jgi:hypothetical protein